MRTILLIIALFFSLSALAQSEQVAKSYYDSGQFEKALIAYQKLYNENRGNINYFLKVVEIHQQLEQLDEAELMLLEIIKTRPNNPQYLVELGYNFQLKGDEASAAKYYEAAKEGIEEKPVYAYYVARRFEDHALIDYAAQVYERAMELRPESNYNMQLARIYGEQGKIEKMFSSYIDFIEINTTYINFAKRSFSEYISDNADDENNKLLRIVLLKKIQRSPNVMWNELLSWLFIQQREYKKAFAQEKAIFSRQQESLQGVIDLALITIEENETEIAFEILDYIIEKASDLETVLEAHQSKLELLADHGVESLSEIESRYKDLFMQYGRVSQTTNLQLSYANFMAFFLNRPDQAIRFLKEALEINLSKFEEAKIKMKLGDVLVFQEKFNEALIYFSQIQQSLKNSTLAQEARFKVAKTSYYKGDFKWAESQLKILKSSTSQLIANDALDLKLLISDNKYEDSTQTALKLYAKADLYAYQNKSDDAIKLLDQVLQNHKTETIVDQALLMQAKLFEKKGDFESAKANYHRIINDFKDDILADDAYYALAEIYANQLGNPEKAQEFYERIIFDHADSIYFVEARKKFRTLRGDSIN